MRCYESLPTTISQSEIIRLDAPLLSNIKNYVGEANAIMVLSLAITEISDLVNVGKQMSETQIAKTAKQILKRFWYLKVEDIKKCFHEKITNEKLFTLDGQTIIRWLGEYDLKRDNVCEDIATNEGKKQDSSTGTISHSVYLAMLEAKANAGDESAKKTLAECQKRAKSLTPDDIRKRETEYWLYKYKYLKDKNK